MHPGHAITAPAAAPAADWRTYRHLFAAHTLALVSTGVATVGLALLAYQLVGADAGVLLGTAYALKMLAYVLLAPIAAAFVERLPRRRLLILLDLIRAGAAFALPFVTEVWQIFMLVVVFQGASAIFTPTYQSTIPDLLPAERDYHTALSKSRLAAELESMVSPAIAAGLLLITSFYGLFVATTIGFLVSAALILRVRLPEPVRRASGSLATRASRGLATFLATPRLRALIALNFVAAMATAMVAINTVVLVQAVFDYGPRATALAFLAFGLGSVAGAVAVPQLLTRYSYRTVMLTGAALVPAALLAGVAVPALATLLALWTVLGLGCSLAITPAGALLRRAAPPEARPSLYATQLALSSACLLVGYPLAGWVGVAASLPVAFALFAALAALAAIAAMLLWPEEARRG